MLALWLYIGIFMQPVFILFKFFGIIFAADEGEIKIANAEFTFLLHYFCVVGLKNK